MNRLQIAIAVLYSCGLVAAGCDTEEKCVADCASGESTDAGSTSQPPESGSESDEGDGDGGSGSGSGSESGSGDGAGLVCEGAVAEADAFLEVNRSCTTDADCRLIDAICYGGVAFPAPCGSLGVSVDADLSQWDAIAVDLEMSCACGAAACGAEVACTPEGVCEAQFGT